MSEELRLTLLGGARITRGDEPLRGFLTAKVQALLCYLAVTGRPHAREALATLLWGDMPQDRASHSLRQALSNLQKLAGPHVAVTRQTVAFDPSQPYTLDTEAFAAQIATAESASIGAARHLRAAVDLYGGDFLAGFSVRDAPDFDDWVSDQRDQMRQRVLGAIPRLVALLRERGDYAEAAVYLRRMLALDPWREDAHRQLMLILAYQGRRAAAIAQYETCRRVLADALGEEPAAATTALYQRIKAGAIKAPAIAIPPNNLPIAPTPIIGREGEIERIAVLLDDPARRLVTLAGPGGIGKTRLATQVAAELVREFEDGAFFIPLAPVREPRLLLSTIARALGIEDVPRQPLLDHLTVALREKRMLLVVDNFEQLIPAAPQLAQVLEACPHLRLLVTSRTSLRLRAERVYEVPPLALPPPGAAVRPEDVLQAPAAAMFVEWARAIQPDFALDAPTARMVAALCIHLEGLPLSIELAAARLRTMPLPALLDRLGARLDVLVSGPRDLPPRQQALRNTIAWSYDLLSQPLQRLFRQLAVFVGGCTLEAVAAVCDAPREEDGSAVSRDALEAALAALAESSLLRREERPGDAVRYRMLETIREYAEKRLRAAAADDAEVRLRHATYFAGMAEEAIPRLRGPEQKAWLDCLEAEHGNVRAALAWARRSDHVELGLRMAARLWLFWQLRGYGGEGRRWLGDLLARGPQAPVAPAVRAEALRAAGVLAFQQGDLAAAATLCEQSLALYSQLGDQDALSSALNSLGNVRRERGEYGAATALYERFLAIGRQHHDEHAIAVGLNNLGSTAHRQGDLRRAEALYEESLALRRATGDPAGVAYTIGSLAAVALDRGDVERAATVAEEELALQRELGHKWGIARALTTLAAAAAMCDETGRARTLCGQGLALYKEIGETWGMAGTLQTLGDIARREGALQQAMECFEESLALYRQGSGSPWEVATVLARRGDAARAMGDPTRARACYEESLALNQRIGNIHITIRCLDGLAALAAVQGEAAHAARLWTMARRLCAEAGEAVPADSTGADDDLVTAARDALGADAWDAATEATAEVSHEQAIREALDTLAGRS